MLSPKQIQHQKVSAKRGCPKGNFGVLYPMAMLTNGERYLKSQIMKF